MRPGCRARMDSRGNTGRMKRLERLDETTLPTGAVLTLYRHDGAYLIRSDGAELMSSRHHHSEDVLADLVCTPLGDRPGARVLIGGLGLGFTLRAALRSLPRDAVVDVVELSDAVIRWNSNADYDLAARELQDPRVNVIQDDAANVIANSAATYDGIMLDVDNGVEPVTHSHNAALYDDRGIRLALAALRPAARLAYWSAVAYPRFEAALRRTGKAVDAVPARAHGLRGATHYIYLVSRA